MKMYAIYETRIILLRAHTCMTIRTLGLFLIVCIRNHTRTLLPIREGTMRQSTDTTASRKTPCITLSPQYIAHLFWFHSIVTICLIALCNRFRLLAAFAYGHMAGCNSGIISDLSEQVSLYKRNSQKNRRRKWRRTAHGLQML